MKQIPALLCCFAIGSSTIFANGLLIYKDQSFHRDHQAKITEYVTAEVIPQNVTVTLKTGARMDIQAGRSPVLLPFPDDSTDTPDSVIKRITANIARFPQHKNRLENLRNDWLKKKEILGKPVLTTPPITGEMDNPEGNTESSFRNGVVTKIYPDGIMVSNSDGLAKFYFKDMTAEEKARFNYDPVAEDNFRKEAELKRLQAQAYTQSMRYPALNNLPFGSSQEAFKQMFSNALQTDSGANYINYKIVGARNTRDVNNMPQSKEVDVYFYENKLYSVIYSYSDDELVEKGGIKPVLNTITEKYGRPTSINEGADVNDSANLCEVEWDLPSINRLIVILLSKHKTILIMFNDRTLFYAFHGTPAKMDSTPSDNQGHSLAFKDLPFGSSQEAFKQMFPQADASKQYPELGPKVVSYIIENEDTSKDTIPMPHTGNVFVRFYKNQLFSVQYSYSKEEVLSDDFRRGGLVLKKITNKYGKYTETRLQNNTSVPEAACEVIWVLPQINLTISAMTRFDGSAMVSFGDTALFSSYLSEKMEE